MFDNNLFGKSITLPSDADVVFVADMFVEHYVGGAELTTEALIRSTDLNVFKMQSSDVSLEVLSQGKDKYWIFGNFANLNFQLIPSIVANLSYSILEYDFKYCKYRSKRKHELAEGNPCNCHNDDFGRMVSAFMYGAKSLFWMSEKQMLHYRSLFPFLSEKNNVVLSSVFDAATLSTLTLLSRSKKDKKWIVLGSPSWIKGRDNAVAYCEQNGLDHEVVWGVEYGDLLKKLASSEGFVYLPNDWDTCPRMVIEAKLLGCKVVLNENVLHVSEEWFGADNSFTYDYLLSARQKFWDVVTDDMNRVYTLSGYTTTYNCIKQNYPYEQCIESLLGFCDEVVVCDAGSDDGTWERLQDLADAEDRLVIHQQKRDFDDKRFAVFDGQQKALARSICTGNFCWQMDSDEVVHPDDYENIRGLLKGMPEAVDLLALPVVEYWGKSNNIRIDVNPWKWRLSRNKPYITHGIPAALRQFDENGRLFAKQGTDGCDYVRFDNYEPIPHHTFYTAELHHARLAALQGNAQAWQQYTTALGNVIESLPTVFHFSWWDIERKIHTYKNYWSRHWESMFGIKQDDTAENNMFFDIPWSEVSDEMITKRAGELATQTTGWVFHSKWDGTNVPGMNCPRQMPDSMKRWCE